jgi:AcrR family transcriptional regulator
MTAVVPRPADHPDELDHRHTPGVRRGRPRNPGTDAAIVEATLELIAETGLTGMSVESVAARAGVGKATIYRRWPCKEALVGDALARLAEDIPYIATRATVRESLVEIVEQIRCKSSETLSGRIMPRMMSHAAGSPELFRLYYDRVIRPRRARVAAVLRAGVLSGELRPDLDVELAVTLVSAPMLYLNLVQAGYGTTTAGTSDALVDALLSGIGNDSANDSVDTAPSPPALR